MKQLPNSLTLANLFAGACAILFAFPLPGLTAQHIALSAGLIVAAAVFDLLDGIAARKLDAVSEKGKFLDSLADLVSFGVAPAALLGAMTSFYLFPDPMTGTAQWTQMGWLARLSCGLLPVAAAYRLARFSTEAAPQQYFQGVPAPAIGLFVAMLGFLFVDDYSSLDAVVAAPNSILLYIALQKPANLLILNLILAGLMIVRWPMLSFKIKEFSAKKYLFHILFVGCSIVLLISMRALAALPIGILYLLCSLLARKRFTT